MPMRNAAFNRILGLFADRDQTAVPGRGRWSAACVSRWRERERDKGDARRP